MNIDFMIKALELNKEKVAVISDEQEYLFADILNEYKNSLDILEKEKIGNGNVVSILADFTPKSMAMFLALINKNCIIVPISKTIKQIDNYIKISQSEVFIDMSTNHIAVNKFGNEVNHKILLDLRKIETAGLILFSSGTTGEPKAAVHDLQFLMEKFKTPGKVLKTITFLLFDHIGGFNTMMHAIANGGTIVTLPKRTPDEVCRLIEKYKVELLPTAPTFLNMILLNETYKKYDLSSLKIISYGTEPMPESTLKRLSSMLPDVKFKQTYGLSEVGIMSTKSESSDSLWMKIGGDGFETKIVDDILYIKSKSSMIGYLNASSPFDKEGWFNTKDKVIQKDGYLKILGRITDLINVGGEKVYPIEIESTLLKCNGVLDAKVFAEDNMLTGKTIIAQIKVDSVNNNREYIKSLRRFCKENLEKFKIPSKFILTEENLYGDRLKKGR